MVLKRYDFKKGKLIFKLSLVNKCTDKTIIVAAQRFIPSLCPYPFFSQKNNAKGTL
ncbi:hypothetical protein Runsl_4950 [Runella slithyformis DSM 19594]|uniref:Uncharacterized protein n=1 Tax=Runella slithyformis (strain ATCC 29530 / DSM 19594 / LMG 11500 / NCIMB 11436 / LSU 4) TaxID=761193 RepID=A0A7U3ZQ19_RUNSL|nr:hypothetical protein Runsl_4950 [Runella slithyformis DSM 19594]